MQTMTRELGSNVSELESAIARSMTKLNLKSENEICRYLPDGEGYLHHFSFKKMKKTDPKKLLSMISDHIIDAHAPKRMPSKPRVYSRTTSSKVLKIDRKHARELLELAQQSNNQSLIEALSPALSLREVQRDLIQSIKEKKGDVALWETYLRMLESSE